MNTHHRSAREMLAELRTILATEREAIRRLDATVVAKSAEEKGRIADWLQAVPREDFVEIREDLHEIRTALRHNGLLLAHARACLREASRVAGGSMALLKKPL